MNKFVYLSFAVVAALLNSAEAAAGDGITFSESKFSDRVSGRITKVFLRTGLAANAKGGVELEAVLPKAASLLSSSAPWFRVRGLRLAGGTATSATDLFVLLPLAEDSTEITGTKASTPWVDPADEDRLFIFKAALDTTSATLEHLALFGFILEQCATAACLVADSEIIDTVCFGNTIADTNHGGFCGQGALDSTLSGAATVTGVNLFSAAANEFAYQQGTAASRLLSGSPRKLWFQAVDFTGWAGAAAPTANNGLLGLNTNQVGEGGTTTPAPATTMLPATTIAPITTAAATTSAATTAPATTTATTTTSGATGASFSVVAIAMGLVAYTGMTF